MAASLFPQVGAFVYILCLTSLAHGNADSPNRRFPTSRTKSSFINGGFAISLNPDYTTRHEYEDYDEDSCLNYNGLHFDVSFTEGSIQDYRFVLQQCEGKIDEAG